MMEENQTLQVNISDEMSALNDNWNERKHLVDQEFELREKTMELIQKGSPRTEIDAAREKEDECRRALTKNSEAYEASLNAWVAALPQ